METTLGETDEGSREVGISSFDAGGVFNGELNGSIEEALNVDCTSEKNVTLKVVPNNCVQDDCSSIDNSIYHVANNVTEDGNHLLPACSNQFEKSDKVPKSGSGSELRDLACEVPTRIGMHGESTGNMSTTNEEEFPNLTHSNNDRELDNEIPETITNCDDSVDVSASEGHGVSKNVIFDGEKRVLSQTCNFKSSKNEILITHETDEDHCVNPCNKDNSSGKDSGVFNLNSVLSNECSSGEYNENMSKECNEKCSNAEDVENVSSNSVLSGDNIVVQDVNVKLSDEFKAVSDTDVSDPVSELQNSSEFDKSSVAGEKVAFEDQSYCQSEDSEAKASDGSVKAKKSRKSAVVLNLTPRRSSRNLNKQKSYVEKEDDPEIQEITPGDPLADPLSTDSMRDDKENSKTRSARKNTIVVNDTKRLVEIATGSKGMKGGKKEPTLVIIDTNSILSGRGPVPVCQGLPPSSSVATSTTGYSVLPIAVPAQGLYPPIRLNNPFPVGPLNPPTTAAVPARPAPPPPPVQAPQILPTLTDDMYVVEAPSFIVPYVYEKPPIKPLKEYLEQMEVEQKDVLKNHKSICNEEKVASPALDSSHSPVEDAENSKDRNLCVLNGNGSDDCEEPKLSHNSDKDTELTEGTLENDSTVKDKLSSETKEEACERDSTPEDKGENRNSDCCVNTPLTDGTPKSEIKVDETSKSSYFDNPLGKFFMQIGINLVQEYVQTDLLRSQKRKREREGKKGMVSTQYAINSLVKNLEFSKENNEPFHLEQKKCEYCSFKTESSLVMAQHLETPHMRNYVYRCNFCPLEVRSPHDILFHMEAEHNIRGRLERAPAFHQCPNCPFEDSQKGKLTRHMLSCIKKHKPERNQEPPPDWEPPAKIPRLARSRPTALGLGAAAYQAMATKSVHPLLPKLVPGTALPTAGNINRGRGRPPIHGRYIPPDPKATQRPIAPTQLRQNMIYRPGATTGQPQVLLPTGYQIASSQIYQSSSKSPTAKLLQQPSISITPLPRQPAGMAPSSSFHPKHVGHAGNPGQTPNKATFVICEICDGYIKDLEQLRNHMQWIHKVKIHPKMIYNRPPLNCQKCQFRFFTDQGLERHLLGSHGLVTSSMQEAANKGKDGGRCPVCGRVYQWKLLNHVARDHNMSLKPAHLSYKCTVCTATFGMYKQFENHVYSAHSVVAKRVIDKKSPQVPRPQSNETLLKPLKINDEITIIPQPARPRPGPASRTGAVSAIMQQNMGKVYSCEKCEATFDGQTGFTQYISHLRHRHLRRCDVKVCRLEDCPTCKRRHMTESILDFLEEHKSRVDVIELSDDEVVFAGQGHNEITITKVSCAPGPKRFKQRLQQKQSSVQVIELEDSPIKKDKASGSSSFQENGEDTLNAVKERLRRRKSLEISQVDSECSSQLSDDTPVKKRRRNDE